MNQIKSTDVLIVGAGISGLTLGKLLSEKYRVNLFEKSRGVGGRIATRRKDRGAWDHGIPYLTQKEIPESLWKAWAPFLKPVPNSSLAQFASATGLTEIAKRIAADLTLIKECRITQISFQEKSPHWIIKDENLKEYFGESLVLAVPVPQAVDLLKNSKLEPLFEVECSLESISYFPQLVLLGIAHQFPDGNSELLSVRKPFEKIIDNGKKGILGSENFFSAYLSPHFSKDHFEEEPERLITFLREALKRDYGIEASHLELKKWRYSQCSHPTSLKFAQGKSPYASLYCIGDGFSGGGFKGAIESAMALASQLS